MPRLCENAAALIANNFRRIDTDNDKIYLGLADTDGKLVITTTHEKREALVRALLDSNPSIDYGFTLREKNDEEK